MGEPMLLIETSGRRGLVGLAIDGLLYGEAALDPARRHARDLAATVRELLAQAGIAPKQVRSVAVSIGPGSFTGLRVGIMSAKAFAYAVGGQLIAVPTFVPIAEQTPAEAGVVDVIADALQGQVYAQRFVRTTTGNWEAENELRIVAASEWATTIPAHGWLSGPGLEQHDGVIPPAFSRVAEPERLVKMSSFLAVALRTMPLEPTSMLALEPVYLRGSSAEEKAKQQAANAKSPG